MKIFITKLKNYLGWVDEPKLTIHPGDAEKWRALAIDVHKEKEQLQREYNEAMEQIHDLKKRVALYSELLVERGLL